MAIISPSQTKVTKASAKLQFEILNEVELQIMLSLCVTAVMSCGFSVKIRMAGSPK